MQRSANPPSVVTTQARGSARLVTTLAAVVVVTLALGVFAMTLFNRAHNEQMYVAAAYLLTQGKQLYRDFAFVQTPYSALTYALVYALSGGGTFLLKAKLVNWLWMIVAALLLLRRAHQRTRDSLFALLLLALYFANYYLMRATIEASNYAMPLALAVLAYVVWLRGAEGRMRYALAAALAGVALGGAVGAKLYYATLALPFGVAALLYPRGLTLSQRFMQGIVPLAAGGLLALLPIFYYALRDWETFLFNNLGYHSLNTQWRLQNGFTDFGLVYKWEAARDLIGNPNYLVLELWLAAALLLGWAARRFAQVTRDLTGNPNFLVVELRAGGALLLGWVARTLPAPGVWLAGSCALVAWLTAFTPSPLFAQYFAMPIPFLLLWMAELYAEMAARERWVLVRLAAICVLVGVLAVLPRHTDALARFFPGDEPWSGVAAVDEAQQIRQAMESRGLWREDAPPYLATLSPIFALEANIPFYPELATGSFVLRVGDLLTPEERSRYGATSPSTLAVLLDANPPAAILIGDEGDAETPLRQYAEARGYTRADLSLRAGELWLRPASE